MGWYTMLKWKLLSPFFFKTLSQGCATTLHCAVSEAAPASSGEYFDHCKPTKVARRLIADLGKDAPEECWKASSRIVKELRVDV